MKEEYYQVYGTFHNRKICLAEHIKTREDAIAVVRFLGKTDKKKYEIRRIVTETEVLYSITGKQAESIK